MAFNSSSQAARLEQTIGSYLSIATGMTTMATGAGTVTVPQFRTLLGIVGVAQAATGVGYSVICTATSGNTATIETIDDAGDASGSAVVMWLAWGLAIN
jgi:hypothetical protein